MELRRLGVRYGRRSPWVLRDVALTLPPGALLEVTGRNGAGKSSLLRVLAGVLAPAAGAVLGRPRVVGWAPERFPVAQAMTAGHYLLGQARVRGLGAGAERAVQREAERLGLQPLLPVRLGELSKGSAQKVGLAQALLVPPDLLVLDEPWSGLDADARDAVPGLVHEVVARGGTVAVADHQQQVAALHPDLRWHVADGTVHQVAAQQVAAQQVAAQQVAAQQVAERVVVEVEVDAGQAPELVADLRRLGLRPRVR